MGALTLAAVHDSGGGTYGGSAAGGADELSLHAASRVASAPRVISENAIERARIAVPLSPMMNSVKGARVF